nr:hypothetical protein CFP56_00662 [Quercus suber]
MSSVLITTVAGGTCVTRNGNVVNNQTRSSAPAQQWILEAGSKGQTFAFRNVEDGKYLHANNGAASAAVGTGAKQFWLLEPGAAPGSCFLRCEDYPNAYLTNKSGSPHNGNVVYVWPKQAVWIHALTWYLHDAKLDTFLPSAQAGGASHGSTEQEAAVQAKETEAIKRENLLKVREAALDKSEAAVAAKLIAVQKKETELEEKAVRMVLQQKELHETNKESSDIAAEARELAVREAALEAREAEMSKRETAVKKAGSTLSSNALPNGMNSASLPTSATDLQAENVHLKAEIAQLRDNHPFKLSVRREKGALRTPNSPNFKLKSTFDPVLLKKFEEGKKVVKSNMRPLASYREHD